MIIPSSPQRSPPVRLVKRVHEWLSDWKQRHPLICMFRMLIFLAILVMLLVVSATSAAVEPIPNGSYRPPGGQARQGRRIAKIFSMPLPEYRNQKQQQLLL